MATTQLSDVFVGRPFTDQVAELSVQKNGLIQSGAVLKTSGMDALASGPGLMFDIPFLWSPANGAVEGTISSDDPADMIDPRKINGAAQAGSKLSRNWAFEAATLVKSANGDVLDFAASQIADVFRTADQKTVLAMLKGIMADNVANDGGDLVVDNSGASITRDILIDAAYKMSDSVDSVALAILHPAIIAALKKADLDNWTARGAADGSLMFDTYLGMAVISDAGMEETGGVYTGYLCKAGAISYGEGDLGDDAVGVFKERKGGGGRGIETLHYSRDYIYHVNGYSYVGTPAGASPTNTELEAAASWDRVVQDKRSTGVIQLLSQA